MRSKYPTSTLTSANQIVPWLAAVGPLSYSPQSPPSRNYFFQYGWIIPDILNEKANRRAHFYFGECETEKSKELFYFWQQARSGLVRQVLIKLGSVTPLAVTAPIAVYQHQALYTEKPHYMLLQHGSYQTIPRDDQPELEHGMVYLYRGIQKTDIFEYLQFDLLGLSAENRQSWLAYLKTQGEIMLDSVVSFNAIHDRTVRTETTHINDRTRMSNDIACKNGLQIDDETFGADLWDTHHQCFSLERWVAERKFGPNYVICTTPITNIRITTFFAGEAEVKVIDPNRVRLVKTVGCEWNPNCRIHG